MRKNIMQKIEEAKGKGIINSHYNMGYTDMVDIFNNSEDQYDLVINGFYYGYMQGMKAQKARDKKKQKKKDNK